MPEIMLIDPARCPLCGEGNSCGMVAGAGTCWCTRVTIGKSVLDRIPPEAKDIACVCKGCAARLGEDEPSPNRA